MLSLIASLALLQAPDQPPRLRTVLDNDAIVLVEPMPKEKTISIQLFASAKYVPETDATHGYRHLLEHLVARGDGTIDRKLESKGCLLLARTLRDAMQIEVTVGPDQLQLGIDALGEILKKPDFKQERLDHELRVMRDELALREDSLLLSTAAWSAAYGEAGLDPLGDFDTMYHATPEKLGDIYDRQFASEGLVVAIAGPVDLDKATKIAKDLLAPRPKSHFEVPALTRKGKPGRATSAGSGECRGAIVPGFSMPQTAACLAAGLALASDLPSCFVIYTPTAKPGLVVLGRAELTSGLGLYVDKMVDPGRLFQRGRQLAREWINRQLRTASGVAYLRGLLLSQGPGLKPETMLNELDSMTQAQFEEATKCFTEEQSAVAVGTR